MRVCSLFASCLFVTCQTDFSGDLVRVCVCGSQGRLCIHLGLGIHKKPLGLGELLWECLCVGVYVCAHACVGLSGGGGLVLKLAEG